MVLAILKNYKKLQYYQLDGLINYKISVFCKNQKATLRISKLKPFPGKKTC